jgi:hypothetical protein
MLFGGTAVSMSSLHSMYVNHLQRVIWKQVSYDKFFANDFSIFSTLINTRYEDAILLPTFLKEDCVDPFWGALAYFIKIPKGTETPISLFVTRILVVYD